MVNDSTQLDDAVVVRREPPAKLTPNAPPVPVPLTIQGAVKLI